MQLSKRMAAVAELVTEGSRVVDVGCDHGYISIWLVENKKAPSAIAMDVNRGPLERAGENIRRHGLEGKIETRLSDGLRMLCRGEGDALVIAGMGGPLMQRILTDGRRVLDGFSELILEPQSEVGAFRRFLEENGFRIVQEKMVEEDGKFYPIIRAVPGAAPKRRGEELEFGPCLLKEQNPVLCRFLRRELSAAQGLAAVLEREAAGSARAKDRLIQLEERLGYIRLALRRFDDK